MHTPHKHTFRAPAVKDLFLSADAELFGRVLTVNIAKPMRIKLGYHRPGAMTVLGYVSIDIVGTGARSSVDFATLMPPINSLTDNQLTRINTRTDHGLTGQRL